MLRMRGYVPQRQMFPLSAWSMSASVGSISYGLVHVHLVRLIVNE
jgi:hypothetical protein